MTQCFAPYWSTVVDLRPWVGDRGTKVWNKPFLTSQELVTRQWMQAPHSLHVLNSTRSAAILASYCAEVWGRGDWLPGAPSIVSEGPTPNPLFS